MESTQLTPKEHLDLILKNPQLALESEMDALESTYPLLVSYYEKLRKARNVKKKQDVINQNEELLQEFIFLCRHNLLFFLTVTGRFDVIRSLLIPQHRLSAKMRYLLYQIEKEHSQRDSKLPSAILSNPNLKLGKANPSEQWAHYAAILSFMDFYAYYTREVERVTREHQVRQALLINQLYNKKAALFNQAFILLQNDPSLTAAERRELHLLNSKLQRASLNPKVGTWKEYLETKEVDRFIEKMNTKNPALNAIQENFRQENQSFEDQFKLNNQNFQKQINELERHFKKAQKKSDKEIDKNFDNLLRFIANCPKGGMSLQQKSVLEQTKNQIKTYKQQYKTLNSLEEKQALLKECSKELENIKQILQARLSPQTVKPFLQESALFNAHIIGAVSLKAEVAAEPGELEPLQEYLAGENPIDNQAEEDKHNNEPAMKLDVSEIHLEHPLLNPVAQTIQASTPATSPQDAVPLKNFKLEMQKLREDPIELSQYEQETFKKEINKLIKNLISIRDHNILNDDDLTLIEQTGDLVKAIKRNGFDQVHTATLKSLNDQLNKLENRLHSVIEINEFHQFIENKQNFSIFCHSLVPDNQKQISSDLKAQI